MPDKNDKDQTPEEEVKKPNPAEETPKDEETPKAKTVEELFKTGKAVPIKTHLEVKREKKEMQAEILELQSQIDKGATTSEVKADLKEIAEKYDVDPDFVKELSSAIYATAKGDVEETLKEKLQPLEAKEKAEQINSAFNEHYDSVIEDMPELKDVVNRDVIKQLSLLPQNAKKTFQQIIEETYGNTVAGKKTIEKSIPRGGKDVSLDMSKINDPEYFKEVMANPDLKKEYNDGLTSRIDL